ncbi:MAG: sulfite exporter TauE/SafE family protein [Clostridia bacterium]|nr:sulfite exporter TauE/SafE family protein [Clostridia bacterium]
MKKYWKHILIGFVSGILNGLFGAGGGSVVVPAMEKFLKMDSKKAHATAIAVISRLSAVSTFFYLSRGYFNLKIWIPVTVGGIAGGLIGAKLLGRIPKQWLKIIFGSVIIVTSIKLIV